MLGNAADFQESEAKPSPGSNGSSSSHREGEGGRMGEGVDDAWILSGYRTVLQTGCDPEVRSAPGHSDLIITPGLMPFSLHTMVWFY